MSVHSSTGMAPADVRDTDVLTIWNKMWDKAAQTRRLSKPKFRVGQRAHQQGEDEIRERRRTKLHHRDLQNT